MRNTLRAKNPRRAQANAQAVRSSSARAGLTRRVMAAAAVAILATAGCSPASPQEVDPTVNPTASEPSNSQAPRDISAHFSSSFDPGTSTLRVTYDVHNTGTEAVVALNQLPAEARASLTPSDVSGDTVLVSTEDGVVQVAQRYFQPSGQGDAPGTPLVAGTLIAPGGTMRHQVTVASPVSAWAPPYPSGEWSRDGITRASQWQFCVGVVHGAPSDNPDFVTVPVGHYDQELLCSEPEQIPEGLVFTEP
ncbi:hypothetical protein GCM10022261_00030 [Brevibacterium daeguense]|uniref:Uncharacterized protein n=1 Tax=Brevibacterium daeguense TaxID=909936 RepID=A0ABP8EEQ0_9MICO|nr:hypothetical protein [Brevibacterium daeguense]